MNRLNNQIFVAGKTGAGKSYFLKNNLLPRLHRKLIIDYQNEYWFEEIPELKNKSYFYAYHVSEYMQKIKPFWKQDFCVIFKNVEEIEELLTLVYRTGYVTVIAEEIHLYDTNKKDILYKLYTTGRMRRINIVGTAQRPARVSRDLTAQANIIMSFQQTEKRDIEYFKEYSEEKSSRLADLKVGEYLIFQGEDELKKILDT